MSNTLDELLKLSRNQRFEASGQMNLGELIKSLKTIAITHPRELVRFDFGYMVPTALCSWRGAYDELAIEYSEKADSPTVEKFLEMCQQANGETYTGWKGGEFTMSESTPIWVARSGESANTALVGVEFCNYIVVLHAAWKEY